MNSNNTLLDALICKGVLISVSIRYWRARKKLSPEDLGLEADKINDRLISLGHKRLLPKDCLQNLALLESRAHALVEQNTFPFLNGVARYLPNEKLQEVNGKLEEMRQQFEAEQRQFLTDYATFRREALIEWRAAAEQLVESPERLVAAIENAFPRPDQMDRYFGFHISIFQVSAPEMPQAELIDFGTRSELMQVRQEAAREAKHRIEESCDEFIRDCTSALRQQTAQLCSDMLATINGTGSVHQKTLNRLLKFIDHFRELNFVNDNQMEEQLEKVRDEFLQHTAQEYRDNGAARTKLVNGLTSLRNRAQQMAQQDVSDLVNSFGELGTRKFTLAA